MNGCAPLPPGSGFIQSVLAFLDCQAQVLGARGWQALAAPGSTLAILLMGFLTLFVALFGYRLLLGLGPDVRTGVLAFVKIGIVFALATSWGLIRPWSTTSSIAARPSSPRRSGPRAAFRAPAATWLPASTEPTGPSSPTPSWAKGGRRR